MIEIANGQVPVTEKPSFKILWDEKKKEVDFEFNPSQFPNFDFILGILHMAYKKAEVARQMSIAANMQQRAIEQAQTMQLRKSLGGLN